LQRPPRSAQPVQVANVLSALAQPGPREMWESTRLGAVSAPGMLAALRSGVPPRGGVAATPLEALPERWRMPPTRRTNMSIVRWDPFRELEEMNDRLNRMFGRSNLATTASGKEGLFSFDWTPSVDIAETAEAFEIKAELPDVKKEDVKVSVEDGELRISGERKQEKEEKGKKFHRVERSYGSFMRSFTLPENVDDSKLTAEYKDGLLNVRLPKTEKAKPKAVAVKVS
jgi:HSP20 family protein